MHSDITGLYINASVYGLHRISPHQTPTLLPPLPGQVDSARKGRAARLLVDADALVEPADAEQHLRRQLLPRAREPLALELLHRGPDGRVRGRQRREREDDDLEAHLAGLGGGDARRGAVLDHVEEQRPRRQVLDGLPGHVLGGDALEEADVGAGVARGAQPGEALVVAVPLEGVGARDDDDVAAHALPGLHGGADARDEGVGVDEDLAAQVAAALGLHLVLDVQRGDARAGVLLRRAGDHDGPAVARVGVGDERHGRVEVGDHLGVRAHVVERADAQVGLAVQRGGRAGAGLAWSAGDPAGESRR